MGAGRRSRGQKRQRQARPTNAEPHRWLHSTQGETLARKNPAEAGLSSLRGFAPVAWRQTHRHRITVGCTACGHRKSPAEAGLSSTIGLAAATTANPPIQYHSRLRSACAAGSSPGSFHAM